MSKIILLRGLPGSGKSTFARTAALEGDGDVVVFSRDSLRLALYASVGEHGSLSYEQEQFVTEIEQRGAQDALRAGKTVVVDALNLRAKFVKRWLKLAKQHEAEVEFVDFLDVPLETLYRRNREREKRGERFVPRDVIETMAKQFGIDPSKGKAPKPTVLDETASATFEKYVPDPFLPSALLCDLDGTLAKIVDRSPFDTDVSKDEVSAAVAFIVEAADFYGARVIYMSGRTEEARASTEKWLEDNELDFHSALFMRSTGDNRSDDIVKNELFNTHINEIYDVIGVIDDRPKVCRMWREKGIFTFQVGNPEKEF